MDIATLELITEVVKTEETAELLALSADDLDLVGGGAYVGSLL